MSSGRSDGLAQYFVAMRWSGRGFPFPARETYSPSVEFRRQIFGWSAKGTWRFISTASDGPLFQAERSRYSVLFGPAFLPMYGHQIRRTAALGFLYTVIELPALGATTPTNMFSV